MLLILQRMFKKEVLTNFFWNMASFSFLPLFQLPLLPIIFFDLIVRSFSQRYTLGLHYNAEIAPTLFMATLFGLKTIKKFTNKNILYKTSLILALNSFLIFRFILHGPFLLGFNPVFYQHKKNFKFLDKPISLIPKNAKVAAQHNLTSRFFHQEVFILRPGWEEFNPDYIIFDLRPGQNPNNFLGIKEEEKEAFFDSVLKNPKYKVIYHEGDQYVLKRKF